MSGALGCVLPIRPEALSQRLLRPSWRGEADRSDRTTSWIKHFFCRTLKPKNTFARSPFMDRGSMHSDFATPLRQSRFDRCLALPKWISKQPPEPCLEMFRATSVAVLPRQHMPGASFLHRSLAPCDKDRMLSALAWNRPLGRLARLPLRLPTTLTVPVLSGPNRGMRWVIGAGNHSCWRGTYERDRLAHACQVVCPGATVFDVGAHAGCGCYTLALSRTVGALGRVLAFEPDAGNLARLKRHLAINHIENVQVIEAAVLDQVGTVPFQSDRRGYLSHVAEEGDPVGAVRLDDFGWPD